MGCWMCNRCGRCGKCGECTCVTMSGAEAIALGARVRRLERIAIAARKYLAQSSVACPTNTDLTMALRSLDNADAHPPRKIAPEDVWGLSIDDLLDKPLRKPDDFDR